MSGNLYATPINFDIYGVGPELQKQIYSKCKEEIREYDNLSQQIKLSLKLDKRLIKRHEIEISIINKVNALGDFSVVNISPITYSQNQSTYSTLDIVQKNDISRLPKSPIQHEKKLTKKSEALNKLFQIWNNYTNRTINLMNQNKFDMKVRSCPVVHCTWGFNKEELKNDVPKLKVGASKYKNRCGCARQLHGSWCRCCRRRVLRVGRRAMHEPTLKPARTALNPTALAAAKRGRVA